MISHLKVFLNHTVKIKKNKNGEWILFLFVWDMGYTIQKLFFFFFFFRGIY